MVKGLFFVGIIALLTGFLPFVGTGNTMLFLFSLLVVGLVIVIFQSLKKKTFNRQA
ncbi:hypothetical protein ACFO3D_13775 [Virgibacillus kekensis]|uniref:LPXTG cell wall anchor domain-containing protein n=1 Tax=Virgibacillus kekensis TaxID=202261 RepID=A0ABV9DLL9_9BACI